MNKHRFAGLLTEHLKDARKTQESLAHSLGIDPSLISHWRSDSHPEKPSSGQISRICKFFGLSRDRCAELNECFDEDVPVAKPKGGIRGEFHHHVRRRLHGEHVVAALVGGGLIAIIGLGAFGLGFALCGWAASETAKPTETPPFTATQEGTAVSSSEPTATPAQSPPAAIRLEAEDGTLDGLLMSRAAASRDRTVWLHAGESRRVVFTLPAAGSYKVSARYSNDNDNLLPLETIEVRVDGTSVGILTVEDTGDSGYGWNTFLSSGVIARVNLGPGSHDVTILVTGGDGYGVEIDVISLERDP